MKESFTIQARDAYGNNVSVSDGKIYLQWRSAFLMSQGTNRTTCRLLFPTAKFAVTFTRGLNAQTSGVAYNITQDATDQGKFTVSYFTTVAGHYSIAVSLDERYTISYRCVFFLLCFNVRLGAEKSRAAHSKLS